MNLKRALTIFLLVALMPAAHLRARGGAAELRGVVKDPLGVLGGVEVSLFDASRGLRFTAVTNDSGYYCMEAIPAATYTLEFRMVGYDTAFGEGFTLFAGESRRQDVFLEVALQMPEGRRRISAAAAEKGVSGMTLRYGEADISDLAAYGRSAADLIPLSLMGNGRALSTADPRHDAAYIDNIPVRGAALAIPISALTAAQTTVARYDAGSGESLGGEMQMAVKSGGDTLKAGFSAFYAPFTGADFGQSAAVEAFASGALIKGKTHFFAGMTFGSPFAPEYLGDVGAKSAVAKIDTKLGGHTHGSITAILSRRAGEGSLYAGGITLDSRPLQWLSNALSISFSGESLSDMPGIEKGRAVFTVRDEATAIFGRHNASVGVEYSFRNSEYARGDISSSVLWHNVAAWLQERFDLSEKLTFTAGVRMQVTVGDESSLTGNMEWGRFSFPSPTGRKRWISIRHWQYPDFIVLPRLEAVWRPSPQITARVGSGIFASLPIVEYLAEIPVTTANAPVEGVGGTAVGLDRNLVSPHRWKSSVSAEYRLPAAIPLSLDAAVMFDKNLSDWTLYRAVAEENPDIGALWIASTGDGSALSLMLGATASLRENLELSVRYAHIRSAARGELLGYDIFSSWENLGISGAATLADMAPSPCAAADRITVRGRCFIPWAVFGGKGLHLSLNGALTRPNYGDLRLEGGIRIAEDISFVVAGMRHTVQLGSALFLLDPAGIYGSFGDSAGIYGSSGNPAGFSGSSGDSARRGVFRIGAAYLFR